MTDLVLAAGVPARPITIGGETRQNLTVNETSTRLQYRFVLPGPELTADELTRCRDAFESAATGARFVVASGSLPPGVPPDWYQQIADWCRDAGTRLVLDTSGAGLAKVGSGIHAITVGLARGWPLPVAVRYGIAAGAAMLLTPGTATCARSDVERFFAAVAPESATDVVCG